MSDHEAVTRMDDFDLIVLGSGSAGYEAAIRTAEAGWKVAVVEERGVWGGTCNNRGCTPKKVLAGAAEVADLNDRYAGLGIVRRRPELDWGALIRFKRTFTGPTSENTRAPLRQAGVTLVEGTARFVDETTIDIEGERSSAEHVHIATGSRPASLDLPGAELLLTSEDVLDLEHLPSSLVFVGGGYISFELAHVAARFGAATTILHRDDRPLPIFDPDIVDTLVAASQAAGIEVVLNAAVRDIERTAQGVAVHTTSGRRYAAAAAVHGAGRPPAIDTLDLPAANVQFGPRGVVVNDHLQSVSNPRVYAGGDAAATGPPLSPVARLHSQIVADNLLGRGTRQPDYRSTPSVVFTEPPVAKVGLSEAEARDRGLDVIVQLHDLAGWFDARRTNLKHTMAKSLVDRHTGAIVGVHLIGNHAEDLINMFALAIEANLTVDQFKAPIYAFPSPSDDARFIV
jgi:glutathione reductase (NADPH)